MGIGPEARGMASGRIVVAAGLFAAFGGAAVVLGIGPLTLGSGEGTRIVGGLVISLGLLMAVAAASLATRRGPGRLLGTVAAIAMAALGGTIVAGSLASLDTCARRGTGSLECSAVVGAAGLFGVGVLLAGLACLVVVRRAPAAAFRRPRRPTRPG